MTRTVACVVDMSTTTPPEPFVRERSDAIVAVELEAAEVVGGGTSDIVGIEVSGGGES